MRSLLHQDDLPLLTFKPKSGTCSDFKELEAETVTSARRIPSIQGTPSLCIGRTIALRDDEEADLSLAIDSALPDERTQKPRSITARRSEVSHILDLRELVYGSQVIARHMLYQDLKVFYAQGVTARLQLFNPSSRPLADRVFK